MKVIDKIQEQDIKLIRALYNEWKAANNGNLSFDAESMSLQSVINASGLPENEAVDRLRNLQGFDFVEFDGEKVKLLPSGIKYARGRFDYIH